MIRSHCQAVPIKRLYSHMTLTFHDPPSSLSGFSLSFEGNLHFGSLFQWQLLECLFFFGVVFVLPFPCLFFPFISFPSHLPRLSHFRLFRVCSFAVYSDSIFFLVFFMASDFFDDPIIVLIIPIFLIIITKLVLLHRRGYEPNLAERLKA